MVLQSNLCRQKVLPTVGSMAKLYWKCIWEGIDYNLSRMCSACGNRCSTDLPVMMLLIEYSILNCGFIEDFRLV